MNPIPLTNIRVIERSHFWEIKEPRTCEHNGHTYHLREHVPRDGRWTFNGDFTNPTFSPSINGSWGGTDGIPAERNHYIVTDGKIRYCGDCTHDFRDQELELAFFNEAEIAIAEGL